MHPRRSLPAPRLQSLQSYLPAWTALLLLALLGLPAPSIAQAPPIAALSADRVASYTPPRGVRMRQVAILSDGVRLHAEVFDPDSPVPASGWPTVIQAHGWGGTAAGFRQDGVALARAGYRVINFDYRGWGLSDGRLVLRSGAVREGERRWRADVEELRGYVDPLEQVADWLNVLHWSASEAGVDASRIGLRGSSYSGGHVIAVAARDPRVKAVVSQVAGFRSDWVMGNAVTRHRSWNEAAARTRGELGYPEPRARVLGNLIGAPIYDKLAQYAPLDDAARLQNCAALFIVAEREELFSNDEHARLAFEAVRDARKKYSVIPGIDHYGVYRQGRETAITLAIDWFDQHLKGATP